MKVLNRHSLAVARMLVGYARCSTDAQDLTARDALAALGVKPNRIYVDHGLTGTNRARPGLREALAACRAGDTLVVTKLDRLARSLTDARNIVEELTEAGVKLNIGGSLHDPTDPVGRLLFNVLGMIAEFESDLIRMRTREGMKVAKAKAGSAGRCWADCRLHGCQPLLYAFAAAGRKDCTAPQELAGRHPPGTWVRHYAPAMSGFPWTSLITAVVPAAAVLAGAALTGRQNNQAGRMAALKADYAGFVQAATTLIEHCYRIDDAARRRSPGPSLGKDDRVLIAQMVSALALARALVDLAGSYEARQAASSVSRHAYNLGLSVEGGTFPRERKVVDFATLPDSDIDNLLTSLEVFLSTVRGEVGGGRWFGPKWMIRSAVRRVRHSKRPANTQAGS